MRWRWHYEFLRFWVPATNNVLFMHIIRKIHFLLLLVVVRLIGERRIIMDEKADGGGFADTESSVKMREGN